ncbi:MAG: rod shape-determining protein RodA [Patescibacteria group bacterium]
MRRTLEQFDWWLALSVLPLIFFGLVTMKSFGTEASGDYFFWRQLMWVGMGIVVFIIACRIDWHVYESNTPVLLGIYGVSIALLGILLIVGSVVRGSQSWLQLPLFSLQPAELAKLSLILVLAKYFARRHVEIALSRHLIVSAVYLGVPLALVLGQPDVGTAMVLVAIWGGMVLFSGITLRQLVVLSVIGVTVVLTAWFFFFTAEQQSRIISFLAPASDPRGAGYHSIQATVAVGSGEMWGKGVGYGTQSRLRFLPESQNDFIYAAFVEEWGVAGAAVVFALFGVIFWRLFRIARRAEGNFAQLFVIGLMMFLASHIVIHIGMNTGMLPITGLSLPFMSYGGSLMLVLAAGIGIAQSIAIHSSFLGQRHSIQGLD